MDPITGLPPGSDNQGLPQPNQQSLNINPRDPNNDITNWLINLFGPKQSPMVPPNQPIPYGPGRFAAQGMPQPTQPLRAQAQPQDQGFTVVAPNGKKIQLTKDEFAKYNKDKDGFWLDYQGGKYAH
jgi:hypothetical protein